MILREGLYLPRVVSGLVGKKSSRGSGGSSWCRWRLDWADRSSRMGMAHAGRNTVQKVWRTPNNNPIVEASPFA